MLESHLGKTGHPGKIAKFGKKKAIQMVTMYRGGWELWRLFKQSATREDDDIEEDFVCRQGKRKGTLKLG